METDKERLQNIINFVCELMNKERFYNWSLFDVLLAVKKCALTGFAELPKEKEEKVIPTLPLPTRK